MILSLLWVSVQLVLGYIGFFETPGENPRRFPLLAAPPMLGIFLSLIIPQSRKVLDKFDFNVMTLTHVVRIPVELCLYYLFLSKAVPEIMTFEGRNFDILAGLTAPAIFYFAIKQKFRKGLLIAWNVIGIILLLNIVSIAILSVPMSFQHFGLDQPNWAVLQFPFTWLPSVVVPIVLFSHLLSLRMLFQSKANSTLGV